MSELENIRKTYYQDQKVGMIDVFVTLRLPINMYEALAAMRIMTNHKSIDDYVSDCVVQDLETMKDGMIAEDMICEKITGKNSPKVQECDKQMRGFLKRQKERDRIEKKTHCKKCGSWLQGFNSCDECGEICK
jgi:hypothetical protein